MRRKKEDAEITRQQLLEAAVRVFSEKGYAATKLSDIGEVAGVTRGAIYWHFGNKKELFIALFKERIDPFFELIDSILGKDLPPLEVLENILRSFFDKIKRDRDFMARHQLNFAEMHMRKEFPEIREYMRSNSKKLFQALTRIIEHGQSKGEIRSDIEASVITGMVATLIAGFGFFCSPHKEKPILDGLNENMIDIFISGIQNNGHNSQSR